LLGVDVRLNTAIALPPTPALLSMITLQMAIQKRLASSITATALLFAAAISLPAQTQQTQPPPLTPHLCDPLTPAELLVKPTRTLSLWPPGTPNIPTIGDDIPHLDLFIATPNPMHTVVVVFPGGGYRCMGQLNEGIPVALWLVAHGISAAVLTYRVAPEYHYPAPLEDGRRAVQWVRANAIELNAQPDHVGLWGFSAGGHLAAYTAATAANPAPADWLVSKDLGSVSSRPDFLILAYPVITMIGPFAHTGSRKNLLGVIADKQLAEQMSAQSWVTPETPPTFIFATSDDDVVPVQNSLLFYQALVQAGVPAEIHLFEHGHHGLGLAENTPAVKEWPSLLANWMTLNHWMD
jgi:acetyl esterase/lipase